MHSPLNFCTLFDSGFLSRGLALYESLFENVENFKLYIFAFDEKSEVALKTLNLPHVTIISLKEFEDSKLLQVKSGRSRAEYCWTCTPSVILYALKKYDLDHCTYLDADIYFFGSPQGRLESFLKSKYSVLITPHNYASFHDFSLTNGIYCVQFMPFKNTPEGLEVLVWWREKCLDWCFARLEDGKFGDQKYLDVWPDLFPSVFIEKSFGMGLAPWNVQPCDISVVAGLIQIKRDRIEDNLVFYHFHALKFHSNHHPTKGSYFLSPEVLNTIYSRYYLAQLAVEKKYHLDCMGFDAFGKSEFGHSLDWLKTKVKSWRDALYTLTLKAGN